MECSACEEEDSSIKCIVGAGDYQFSESGRGCATNKDQSHVNEHIPGERRQSPIRMDAEDGQGVRRQFSIE